MVKPISVAGIPVKPYQSIDEILSEVFVGQDGVTSGVATAINPEKILTSLNNPKVKQILLDATFPYADGIGVVKVLEKKMNRPLCRIPGVELWLKILTYSINQQIPVYIVGAKPEVSQKSYDKLIAKGVNIVGCSDGYFQDKDILIKDIKHTEAKIVIVALGSPRQELFINECKKVSPNCFYMGVGGSLDVFVGHVKRAPKLWCKLHLEWCYRLLNEPSRFFRQMKLLKFIYLYMLNRL